LEALESIVSRAAADFSAAADPASLENAKARYRAELSVFQKSLGSLPAESRKAAGAAYNAAKQQIDASLEARRVELAGAKLSARLAEEALDVTLPGQPHLAQDRGDLPLDRLRRRRRSRDRDRLVQLHRAQQPREPSGALDAGHVLRRLEGSAGATASPAHPHERHADPLRAHAQAADQGHRPRPDLSRRLGRDALADVPPGRRPVDRRERELRRSQGRVHRVPAPLLRERRSRSALPSFVLPFHRALGRDRHEAERQVARDLRFWTGASGLERLTMLRYGIEDLRLFFDGDLRFLEQFS